MGKRLTRTERAAVARATAVASAHFGVFRPLLSLPTRCKIRVTTARQVAMYLAHCSGQVPIGALTTAFGRDASTINHDIKRIEDMRDEGSPFDAEMTYLERQFAEPVVRAKKARAA